MSESLHPLQLNPPLQQDICSRLSLEEAIKLFKALKVERITCPFPFYDQKTRKDLILPEISEDSIEAYRLIQDSGLNKALELAIRFEHENVARMLVYMGSSVDQFTSSGSEILFEAAANNLPQLVSDMIQAGAKDNEYRSPLIAATMNGHAQVIKVLLDAGFDINATNSEGWTPLMYAIQSRNAESVRTLLEDPNQQVDVNTHSRFGSPLEIAVRNGNVPIVKLLITAGAKDPNGNLLSDAISSNNLEMIELFLDPAQGQDLNLIDAYGSSPLIFAIIFRNVPVAKMLLEAGANPNIIGRGRMTALQTARKHSTTEMEDLLRQYGAK